MNGDDSQTARASRKWSRFLLYLILLLALAMRWPSIGSSLWLDELHTAWVVDGGLGNMLGRAAMGNTSPLYFLLPWLSVQLFGLNEFALRLPSLIAGVLLVPAVYWLVWRWTQTHVASLLAAFLVAIDLHCIYFSVEARAYATIQLLAVVQVMVFWRTCQQESSWRAVLIALSVLLFYLHYTTALFLIAEAVYYVIALRLPGRRLRYHWKAALLDAGIVAACCLPSLPHLRAIAAHRQDWEMFIHRPGFFDVMRMFPIQFWGVAALLLLVWMIYRGRTRDLFTQMLFQRHLPQVVLTCCWAMIPLLIASALSRFDIARLFLRRYLIASEVTPMVIMGLFCGLVAPTRTQTRWAMVFAALGIAGLWFAPQYRGLQLTVHGDQDWRGAVRKINETGDFRGWPVLVRSGLIEAEQLTTSRDPQLVEYSLLPVGSIYRIRSEHPLVPLATKHPGKLTESEIALIKKQPGVWLITPGSETTKNSTLKQIRQRLLAAGLRSQVESENAFDRLWLIRLRIQPAG